MAILIPTITFEELSKVVESGRVSEMKSVEVVIDGKAYYFTNPNTDYIKLHSENTGALSNSLRGKEPRELLETDGSITAKEKRAAEYKAWKEKQYVQKKGSAGAVVSV